MSRAAVERNDLHYFFRELSAARSRALVLDYDGTLAPFCRNRHNATPYPGVPDLLRRIMHCCDTRLVIVSGRAAHEVPPLLGLRPAPEVWGTNGVEKIHYGGLYEELPVDEDALQVLAQAETRLEAAGLGRYIEVKLAAVALHWRGLSSAEILQI